MSRWDLLPKPPFFTEDSELFLVNVLMSSLRESAIESIRSAGGTYEEAHALLMKLCRRGYVALLEKRTPLSEDGVDDFLRHLREELEA